MVAVFLLDWPQQTLRFVEIGIVRPAVQRRETLHAAIGATATIAHAVGTGAVPSHTNKERTVVSVVSRPPVLRRSHCSNEVGL